MPKKTAIISPLTREEVYNICKEWQKAKKSGIGVSIRSAFSKKLSGQTIEFKFDDFTNLTYKIESGEKIYWTENRKDFNCEYAQILELETVSGIFLINHLRSGTFPLENVTLLVDVENGLVTMVFAKIGGAPRPRDVERTFHFGYINSGSNSVTKRHNYTTDLVGKIIDWHYDNENEFVVKHLYVNNEHMVYMLIESDIKENGLVEAAECDYIKIRENVYIMSWLEKGHQGMQGVTLMDLSAMQDVGSFFGISICDTLDNYTFAANGKISNLGQQIL